MQKDLRFPAVSSDFLCNIQLLDCIRQVLTLPTCHCKNVGAILYKNLTYDAATSSYALLQKANFASLSRGCSNASADGWRNAHGDVISESPSCYPTTHTVPHSRPSFALVLLPPINTNSCFCLETSRFYFSICSCSIRFCSSPSLLMSGKLGLYLCQNMRGVMAAPGGAVGKCRVMTN